LLGRTPNWAPALQPMILILASSRCCPLGRSVLPCSAPDRRRWPLTAYTLSTVRRNHAGAPDCGSGRRAGFGPGRRWSRRWAPGRPAQPRATLPPGAGGAGGAGFPGGGATPPNFPGTGAGGFRGPRGAAGGLGGLLNGTTVGTKLEALLRNGSSGYRWVAAAVGANNAASYQLASDQAVMAIGGFNGSDPSPTLAEFQAYVRGGQIHYFLGGGGFGVRAAVPAAWSATRRSPHYTACTVNGVRPHRPHQPLTHTPSGGSTPPGYNAPETSRGRDRWGGIGGGIKTVYACSLVQVAQRGAGRWSSSGSHSLPGVPRGWGWRWPPRWRSGDGRSCSMLGAPIGSSRLPRSCRPGRASKRLPGTSRPGASRAAGRGRTQAVA
jgi:hypothetical protein